MRTRIEAGGLVGVVAIGADLAGASLIGAGGSGSTGVVTNRYNNPTLTFSRKTLLYGHFT